MRQKLRYGRRLGETSAQEILHELRVFRLAAEDMPMDPKPGVDRDDARSVHPAAAQTNCTSQPA